MSHYTHGHHESVLRSHRWRTAANSAGHLLPHLRSDQHLLDIGAGPGTITVDLARHVGRVTATEVGEDELDLTREAATRAGIDTITFAVADVHDLPFEDGLFDVVHAHQVLQHVGDPVRALREMRRVTKPGGLVAVRDSDYRGFVWHPQVPALEEWMALYQRAARANGGEPDAGRQLHAWARAAGFVDVTPSSSTWCYATTEDREWWGGMWADRIIDSEMAGQVIRDGLAQPEDLQRIRSGWQEWAGDRDGWLSILHGEILCRV